MLRVRTVLTGWDGGPGLSTHYFETPLQDAAAAARAVEYVHQFWLIGFRALLWDSALAQVSGQVDVITAATGAITDTLSVADPAGVPGFGGAAEAPPAIAGNCRLRTNTFIAGRRLQGRLFISPLSSSVIDNDGTMKSVNATNSVAHIVSVLALLDAGDLWVVWHRPKGGVGGSFGTIVSGGCPKKLAVLTSRRD